MSAYLHLLGSATHSYLMQIEKANLAELDWALANMDTGGKGKKHNKPTNELVDADTKIKEDVRWLCVGTPRISNLFWLQGMNFKGLGALLFDDGVFPCASPLPLTLIDTIICRSPTDGASRGGRHQEDARRNRRNLQPYER